MCCWLLDRGEIAVNQYPSRSKTRKLIIAVGGDARRRDFAVPEAAPVSADVIEGVRSNDIVAALRCGALYNLRGLELRGEMKVHVKLSSRSMQHTTTYQIWLNGKESSIASQPPFLIRMRRWVALLPSRLRSTLGLR